MSEVTVSRDDVVAALQGVMDSLGQGCLKNGSETVGALVFSTLQDMASYAEVDAGDEELE